MENKYIELEYGKLKIIVKMEDEGVVLDVWEDNEVVATTWSTYDELDMEVDHY